MTVAYSRAAWYASLNEARCEVVIESCSADDYLVRRT
jgi:hypothetical protein